MRRGTLKNIINKSKGLSNKPIGDPFDEFKKSLPIEVNDNYRLEAAWKAYGSPKNYQEALWQGMIQPIDETNVKLPSIGYNEETDEYEYLNSGKDNETVAKDIRVWDNNVIPLVQELKQGGFIRIYDEEKDCWKYSKNKSQETQNEQGEIIEQFKSGGKPSNKKHWKKPENWTDEKIPYEEWVKDINKAYLNDNYDLKTAYESDMPKEELERWKWAVNSDDPEYYINYQDEDGKYIYHLGSIAPIENGNYVFLKKGREENNPELHYETDKYWSGENGLRDTHNLVFSGDRYYYIKRVPDYKGKPLEFKQGGQMNVIPEGALHARKNNMEGAGEDFTHKGIPVMDNNGQQQAEIEREEWTMTKELTEDVENWYKKFYNEKTSQKEKDELAIQCGKRITKELLHNTDDRANLIAKILEEEEE